MLQASDSHLDLGRAPYDLYGVKYIRLVSPGCLQVILKLLDLIRAQYRHAVYRVACIGFSIPWMCAVIGAVCRHLHHALACLT